MTCQHHWILKTPQGATVRGTCKLCGKRRYFPVTPEGRKWQPRTSSTKPATSGRHTSGQGTWMKADGDYRGTN